MEQFHGTTIISVRRQTPQGMQVAIGGDGQVTLGHIVVKGTARKVRKLHHDRVLAGFAGATADAFTLFERFEAKLEKHHGHATEVMGASFRNKGEITELAGCDLLTIAPSLLAELAASDEPLVRKLDPAASAAMDIPKRVYDEKTFRLELNDDAMATEKTAQGIRNFSIDIVKLEKVLSAALAAA
jgi:hypothetical protein